MHLRLIDLILILAIIVLILNINTEILSLLPELPVLPHQMMLFHLFSELPYTLYLQ